MKQTKKQELIKYYQKQRKNNLIMAGICWLLTVLFAITIIFGIVFMALALYYQSKANKATEELLKLGISVK